MKPLVNNTIWITLGLIVVFLFLGEAGYAQNTKGDRPPGTTRENRFRIPKKKSDKRNKTTSVKRVKPRNSSLAGSGREYSPRPRAKGGERAGRPVKPTFSKTKPQKEQKPWKGDLTGRRLRTKGTESTTRTVYPQAGRYMRKNVPDREIKRSRNASANRVTVRSRSGKTKNVFPQSGRFVNNPSVRPRDTQRPVSNKSQIARLNRLQSTPQGSPPKRKKIVPRSVSRSYVARKSINVYANFARPKRKSERAYTKDLAGRPLRAKNYETPRQGVIKPTFQPYHGRKRVGDRPYSGPAAGKHRSATKPGERAWTGDVTGRQIRHRDRSSKRSVEGSPLLSRKVKSASRSGETRPGAPLIGKAPPRAAISAGIYRGTIKSRKHPKGGGSISGKLWNNKGFPIATRTPKGKDAAKAAGYPGNIKRFKVQPGFGDQGEEFTGNIKYRKPLKGGGSVSGKLWNNDERPLVGKRPIEGRAATFQGNIKAKRPEKGGGSVSGKLWNNNETAIRVKTPPARARKEGEYPGNFKRFQVQPGFSDQGEEFTGHIKLSRFRKNYVQNKKADDESIKKKRPEKTVYAVDGLQAKMKRRDYVRHKNSSELALLKLKPTKATQQVAELQVKVKQYDYKHNPSSAKEALNVREPGKAFARATDYQGNIKMQKFSLFEKNRRLHPDSKFVKTNKNNVPQEKDVVTNLKLWWARLFKKQETQPDHLKDKGKKPRYDKGEKGLWYE